VTVRAAGALDGVDCREDRGVRVRRGRDGLLRSADACAELEDRGFVSLMFAYPAAARRPVQQADLGGGQRCGHRVLAFRSRRSVGEAVVDVALVGEFGSGAMGRIVGRVTDDAAAVVDEPRSSHLERFARRVTTPTVSRAQCRVPG
jgi:hypothetical protein